MNEIKFRGYKLSFELHAAHGNVKDSKADYHFHTFSIVLWLKKLDDNMESFDDMEKRVKVFLEPFENAYLGDHALFEESDLTVESLGDIFYREMEKLLNDHRFLLLRLDIWENPVRQYSVTKYRMDMTIHPLNITQLLGTSHIQNPMEEIMIEEAQPLEELIEVTKEDVDEGEIIEILEEPILPIEPMDKPIRKHYRLRMRWKVSIACMIFIAAGLLFYTCIQGGMISLYGNDTLCHLYRSDYVLSQILQGNFFPLYDPAWYNGVEVMRYWGPLPIYILALIQLFFGTTSLSAYMILLPMLMFVSALGWLRFGVKYHHVGVAVVVGLLWFFLPENTRLFVLDGNIPRVLINALLPHLLYSYWMFLQEHRNRSALAIVFLMSLCIISHLGVGAMVLVSLLLVGICQAISQKNWKRWFLTLPYLILPFLIVGIWSVPAMIGGGASKGSATNQVMASFFAPLMDALNPMHHWDGNLGSFYISFAVFLLALFGIVFGKKNVRPVFISGMIIILCTSLTAYEIFLRLPFSQFLWMIRFIPFALGIVMMGFLLWNGLRKWVTILLCIFLCLDSASSLLYLYHNFWGQEEQDVITSRENLANRESLDRAKEFTTQRLSVMDLSGYGAFAPYYVSGVDKKVSYVFGAGWEGAGTSTNIVGINTALEFGHYPYLFDRNLELGADTIVIPIAYLARGENDIEEVIAAGKKIGYELVEQDQTALIFHFPTEGNFAIKTTYQNLAIGESAGDIAMLYPNFEVGNSVYLEDYTMESLLAYQTIYLSKFQYRDKLKAEELLRRVSEAGVDVFIDMNFVPVDSNSRKQEFFQVVAQSYRFSERFPDLLYQEESYHPSLFSAGDTTWNAVTLSGLDNVLGTSTMNNKLISFYGTKENDHLHFLGFNLMYHTLLTKDQSTNTLIQSMMKVDTALPQRQVVPIVMDITSDRIHIDSIEDDVNTGIAALDILHNDNVEIKNQLIHVNKGTTVLEIRYPYFAMGGSVSLVGISLTLLSFYWMFHKKRKKEEII